MLHDAFDSAFRQVPDNKTGDSKLHFVYAGIHDNLCDAFFSSKYGMNDLTESVEDDFLRRMKKRRINSATMTTISMLRKNLVTIEDVENYYSRYHLGSTCGWWKPLPWKSVFGRVGKPNSSFQDDLDSLFENFRLGKFLYTFQMLDFTFTRSHFLPKLTEDEEVLADKKDSDFLNTFFSDPLRDVRKNRMRHSKSDSKFVLCDCEHRFFLINL